MINIPHPHLFGPAVHLSHIIRLREFWIVCCRIGRNNASESLSRLLDPKCMLARATIYLYYRFDLFNNVSISLSTRNEMRDWERGDSKYLNTHLIFSEKVSILLLHIIIIFMSNSVHQGGGRGGVWCLVPITSVT